MEFFIKQNTTTPILMMDVVNDGRTLSYQTFNEILENTSIKFSMNDEKGNPVIIMNNAYITEKDLINADAPSEYYIYYKWVTRDTRKKGRYTGEFVVITDSDNLIVPIKENLYINII